MDVNKSVYYLPGVVLCPGGCGQRHTAHIVSSAGGEVNGGVRCEKCKADFIFELPSVPLVSQAPLALLHSGPL